MTATSGDPGAAVITCVDCGAELGRTDPILWTIVSHADYRRLALAAAFKYLLVGHAS